MTDYPADAFDHDVKRYLELDELIKDLMGEQSAIKARIRGLGTGVHHAPCGVDVSVTPQRRFNPDHAREVIPAAFLPLVEVTVVDGKKAKAALPPAIYEQCQVETGDPRVTFR